MNLAPAIVIEFGHPERNREVFFAPLKRSLRGRFDVRNDSEPEASKTRLAVIPGQRLRLDPDAGTGEILEPLHEPQYASLRETIARANMKLEPPTQPAATDWPTLVFWTKRAVESGHARVLAGELPEKVEGTPRTRVFGQETVDPRDRELADLKSMNAKLTTLLLAALPPAQRKEAQAIIGGN